MSDAQDQGGTRVCPSCGTENWPSARFCAECGTRLVDEAVLARDFEYTVADVVDDQTTPEERPQHVVAAPVDIVPDDPEATLPAVTVASVSSQPPPPPTEWPATFSQTQPQTSSKKTWLWILLGIFAFILACCCGLGLLVAVSSSNDTGLHRELTLLASF